LRKIEKNEQNNYKYLVVAQQLFINKVKGRYVYAKKRLIEFTVSRFF